MLTLLGGHSPLSLAVLQAVRSSHRSECDLQCGSQQPARSVRVLVGHEVGVSGDSGAHHHLLHCAATRPESQEVHEGAEGRVFTLIAKM